MKGEAKKTEEGLVVKFEDIANVKDALKEGIALCMQGECECETEAYQHVEKIEMLEDKDSISVNLKGKNIPKGDVEKCIQYYKEKLSD
ncbi:MAG: hypothetical protein ACMUHY_02920 [Thermoplasmatota archaeon]